MSDGAADNGNGSGGSSQAEQPQLNSQEAVVQRFRMLQNDVQMLSSKSTELELERQEHDLVLEALRNCGDDGRRCFRLVGGVLVERTVGEVKPAVERNRDGIKDSVDQLNKRLELSMTELKKMQEKYKIREKPRSESMQQSDSKSESAGQAAASGVLV